MNDKKLIDADYTLTEGAAWFTAGGFAVRIRTTADGLTVDIYQDGQEDGQPISSAHAQLMEADQ